MRSIFGLPWLGLIQPLPPPPTRKPSRAVASLYSMAWPLSFLISSSPHQNACTHSLAGGMFQLGCNPKILSLVSLRHQVTGENLTREA